MPVICLPYVIVAMAIYYCCHGDMCRLRKIFVDLQKQVHNVEAGNVASGSKPATMDRCLGELIRILDKRVPGDHSVVHAYGGLPLLTRIIQLTSVSITSTPSSAAAVAMSRWVTLNCTVKFIFSDMSDSTSVCVTGQPALRVMP